MNEVEVSPCFRCKQPPRTYRMKEDDWIIACQVKQCPGRPLVRKATEQTAKLTWNTMQAKKLREFERGQIRREMIRQMGVDSWLGDLEKQMRKRI